MMLPRVAERGHSCLVLDLWGRGPGTMSAGGFLQMSFYPVEKAFPFAKRLLRKFLSNLLRVLIKNVGFCLNAFFILISYDFPFLVRILYLVTFFFFN